MKNHTANALMGTALAIAALSSGGCFSSSGDDDSPDMQALDPHLTLDSDEAQLLLAWRDTFEQDIPSPEVGSPFQGTHGPAVVAQGVAGTAETRHCDSGTLTLEENKLYRLDDLGFPEPFNTSGNVPALNAGEQIRADDCTVDRPGLSFHMDGQMDLAQDASFEPSIEHFRFGGYAGSDQLAELTGKVVVESPEGELTAWGTLYACSGCVEGRLGNLTGNPDRDFTLVANFDGEFERERHIFGEGPGGDALVVHGQSLDASHVVGEVNGRLAYADLDKPGCGFDLTFVTEESLLVDDSDSDSETTVG
ncbi:hypothetical protein, partial [Aquisalimonas sp.]|uniref:hypothetical protein n=1 Tax=Aquisalimonas sp. TaxID=1872621 RepID=UPI0025BADFDD